MSDDRRVTTAGPPWSPALWWNRLVASDPGLNRLRMALSSSAAMVTALGVEWLFAQATARSSQQTLVAMLLGAVVAMMGSMGLGSAGDAVAKARIAVLFPVAVGVGMTVGAAVGGHRDLMLGVFVLVMFVAVFVRRFGAPFFIYGFMGWMGYFFAAFLGASFGALPYYLAELALAAAWVLLLSSTVLRSRPERVLQRSMEAIAVRSRRVAGAAAALVAEGDSRQRRAVLRRRYEQLLEASLIAEGLIADDGARPEGWGGAELRRLLIDAQLSVDGMATVASELAGRSAAVRDPAARLLRAVAAGDRSAMAAARAALGGGPDGTDPSSAHLADHLVQCVQEYQQAADAWLHHPSGTAEDGFEPAVTLMMGNLPGSAAVAGDVTPRGRLNPLRRLDLVTRQAVQVAVAGGVAIAAGKALSSTRYYWAVIAAFVVFSGTATRAETFIKGANRVLGTLAGLGAAIILADATAGNDAAVLVTITVSLFLGFYLLRVAYGYMIFFITIMVGQLYSVLGEFSSGLLLLRLEETAVGAAIGIVVAVLFAPLSTSDTARHAADRFWSALCDLLQTTADRADTACADPTSLDRLTRSLDLAVQQLIQVSAPLARTALFGADPEQVRHRRGLYLATATAARRLVTAANRTAPDPEMAETLSILAGAAGSMAERRTGSATEKIDHACAELDRRERPLTPAARSLAFAAEALIRGRSRLHEIARTDAGDGYAHISVADPAAVDPVTT